MSTKLVLLYLIILITSNALSQADLSFEEALETTLENNFDIKVARINESVANNNAQKLNNGYFPSVSASSNYGWTFNGGMFNTNQGESKFDPTASYNYGIGLDLNYTIWDGNGRKYAYLQSQLLRELSTIQVQQLIENTILELSRVYYEVSRIQGSVQSFTDAVIISSERLARAEFALEYGQGTQLDILNAKVDLNTDSVNLVNTQQALKNSLRNLNFIMATSISRQYKVEKEIPIDKTLNKEHLLEAALKKNVLVISADKNLLSQEFSLKRNRSALMPSVSANLGYDYRGSIDPNGAFVTGSTSIGPNAGLSLNWNIFSGQARTKIKNEQLNLESLKIEKQKAIRQVEYNLLNAFESYYFNLFVLNSDREKVETAIRNFETTKETFQQGRITSLEFRQAQLNLLNTRLQLNQSRINAKNAELQVLAFAGKIIPQN